MRELFSQIKRTLPEKAPRWLVHRLEKMERTTRLFREQDSRYIRYLKYDRDGTPFLCAVNKDIPKQLRRALWEQRIPVILTSGTLKAGNDFHPVMEKTGLDSLPNVRTYSAPSPFDYKRNCLLYFPESSKGEPHGSNSESKRIAKEILQLVHATGGHTLVLFTSYSLMGAVYSLVKDQMPVPLMEVWRNSQDTIRRFKREQNAVLFAAGSCWEGIDFPGDIVSSLIVPRLPFPVPDPIREAQQANYMTLQDYINAVIVPEMQVKLRQGFGRAIRTETDTCVVSILDHRAAPGRKYHQEVMEALPPVPVTRQIEDVERFIRARKGPDYFFVYGREQMCLKTEKCERFGFTAGAEGRV
ncbi:ATP-dependent DNA helicase [Candidatus Allofournierella excrementavium]|uniref:ATP-dependent DNA helicase n=1 Tax=Candidatus Allofournierella excrementavium TaxID=2838591 RepID=UPI003AB732E9